MPLTRALERRRFSEAGPVSRPLSVGDGLAAMLLCLQDRQRLQAPESDLAETVFTVLDGAGFVTDGDERFPVRAGDVVHVLPGGTKVLEAGAGSLTGLGVRLLGGSGGRRG